MPDTAQRSTLELQARQVALRFERSLAQAASLSPDPIAFLTGRLTEINAAMQREQTASLASAAVDFRQSIGQLDLINPRSEPMGSQPSPDRGHASLSPSPLDPAAIIQAVSDVGPRLAQRIVNNAKSKQARNAPGEH